MTPMQLWLDNFCLGFIKTGFVAHNFVTNIPLWNIPADDTQDLVIFACIFEPEWHIMSIDTETFTPVYCIIFCAFENVCIFVG
jgi:hypothetical protein